MSTILHSTDVHAFSSAVWRACSRTPRCICAHVVFGRNRQLALLKIAPRAIAPPFLAIRRACNARLFQCARRCVGAFGGELAAYHSAEYRCVTVFVGCSVRLQLTFRSICAHMVFQLNRQRALFGFAPRATARLFLAVPRARNVRLLQCARKCVGAFGGELASLPFCRVQMCQRFGRLFGAPAIESLPHLRTCGFSAQQTAGVA